MRQKKGSKVKIRTKALLREGYSIALADAVD
jgi:hypothetical protein